MKRPILSSCQVTNPTYFRSVLPTPPVIPIKNIRLTNILLGRIFLTLHDFEVFDYFIGIAISTLVHLVTQPMVKLCLLTLRSPAVHDRRSQNFKKTHRSDPDESSHQLHNGARVTSAVALRLNPLLRTPRFPIRYGGWRSLSARLARRSFRLLSTLLPH